MTDADAQPNGNRDRAAGERPVDREPGPSVLRAAPVLMRLAAGAWWRASGWTLQTSLRTGIRLMRGAARGEALIPTVDRPGFAGRLCVTVRGWHRGGLTKQR